MIKFSAKTTIAAACFAGTALLTAPAFAAPFAPSGAAKTSAFAPSLISEVEYRGNRHRARRGYAYKGSDWRHRRHAWRHNHRHYRRYRTRRPGYDYYWGGWWYAVPFFLFATTYPRPYYDYRDPHVEWCLDRHPSYDPRTDRYRARSGRQYICRSPYR